MMMRRYRFVEDDLIIGKPETDQVVVLTRQNFKLWNRIDVNEGNVEDKGRLESAIAQSAHLMFQGLAEILEDDGNCENCYHRASYGAKGTYKFGGVELCDNCKVKWRDYLEEFPKRAAKVFPELRLR